MIRIFLPNTGSGFISFSQLYVITWEYCNCIFLFSIKCTYYCVFNTLFTVLKVRQIPVHKHHFYAINRGKVIAENTSQNRGIS